MIRPVCTKDAEDIVSIYNYYIEHTTISFEETPVTIQEMTHRIDQITIGYPWLVYEVDEKVIGYAYANSWRSRSAYRHSAETSVYVCQEIKRQGVGTQLYEALKMELKNRGFHAIIACVTLPNAPSISFHERIGFSNVGIFREVGKKFGAWLDVSYWSMML